MADDPVEAARRRQTRIMRGQSYFPAANLRQFEGTELAPPGRGTYFNPERYIGASYGNQRRAARELANQYQSDLAFNVMHNPRIAAALESERIGAQYGGGGTFAGKPGYQTVRLPSGGTTVVTDAVAKRLNQQYGYGASTTATPPTASYFPAANPYALPSPRFASERGDLMGDIEGTFYGGGQAPPTPTPTPRPTAPRLAGYQSDFLGAPAALQERFGQPRRYFDL